MAFTPKLWKNKPEGGTRLDAAGLIDLEQRLGDYADTSVATEAAARTTADTAKVDASTVGQPDGVASLGTDGKVPTSQVSIVTSSTPGAYVQPDPPAQTGPGIWIDPDTGEVYYQEGGVPQGPTDVDVIQGLATGTGVYVGEGPGAMGFEETTPAQAGKALIVQSDGSVLPQTQAALQAGNNPPVAFPGFMAPALGPALLVNGVVAVLSQNIRHYTRLVAPKAGAVRDLTIQAGAPGAGNVIAALYDVGGIASGTYTKLWESPSTPAANSVPQSFDPAAVGTKFNGWDGTVAAFQHLLFALVTDSATTSAVRVSLGSAAYALLSSARGLVGGLQPKPFGVGAASGFSAPATLTEADIAVTSTYCLAAYGWVI